MKKQTRSRDMEKFVHFYVQYYQYDFIDMQAEVKVLAPMILMLENIPSKSRNKDRIRIKYTVFDGNRRTDEIRERTISLNSLLNSYRRRRTFIWTKLKDRMISIHVKWHLFKEKLERIFKPTTPPINRTVPYRFKEIRFSIYLINENNPLKSIILSLQRQGRFLSDNQTSDSLFRKEKGKKDHKKIINSPTMSDKDSCEEMFSSQDSSSSVEFLGVYESAHHSEIQIFVQETPTSSNRSSANQIGNRIGFRLAFYTRNYTLFMSLVDTKNSSLFSPVFGCRNRPLL